MSKPMTNPYLPYWEYIPDGEPHVFDGRVYVYGSHDLFRGWVYCLQDYVCWSAPEDDLSDWRFEGVIYRRDQDPKNPGGWQSLYAPDVTRGPKWSASVSVISRKYIIPLGTTNVTGAPSVMVAVAYTGAVASVPSRSVTVCPVTVTPSSVTAETVMEWYASTAFANTSPIVSVATYGPM